MKNNDWILCNTKMIIGGQCVSDNTHQILLDGLFEFARYVISLHDDDSNYISNDGLRMYDINVAEFDDNGNLVNDCEPIIDADNPSEIYKIDRFVFTAIKYKS